MAEAEGLDTGCTDRHCGMDQEDFLLGDIEHTDGRVLVAMLSAPVVFGIPCDGDSGTRSGDGDIWQVSGWSVAQRGDAGQVDMLGAFGDKRVGRQLLDQKVTTGHALG